jgi:hypothetical protein
MPPQDPAGQATDPRLDPASPEYDADYAAEVAAQNPPPDLQGEARAASNGDGGGEQAPSVLGRLRRAYAAGDAERTTVISIAPGRYHDLAAKYRPLDTDLRRKLQRRAERTGAFSQEANLNFQATLLADACLSIMIRPEPGAEWEEAHKVDAVSAVAAGEVVRFDRRLAAILGMELIGGESQADVARLVFGDEAAFDVHYTQFSTWSTQLAPGEGDEDEDDEDGEGSSRPT